MIAGTGMEFGGVTQDAVGARSLEELGYTFIGQGDYLATFTNLLEVAQSTKEAKFGSFILTPYGRHPAVVAMEAARIQSVSRGRLVMCVGRGSRSAALMGRPPIPLEETGNFVTALRSLVSGEDTRWDGRSIPRLPDVNPVPVYLSAYGPTVRQLAGRVGDGVVLAAGSSVADLSTFLADVARGAAEADRSFEDLDIWLLCRGSVRPSRAEALDDVRGLLAASGYRHLRAPSQIETVPEEFREPLRDFQRRFDPNGFEGYQPSWDGPNAQLVVELGLEEYLAKRFAIVGTPEECRGQVEALGEAGVKRIVFAPGSRESETLYERLAGALIPSHG